MTQLLQSNSVVWELIRALRRHKRKALAFFVAVMAFVLVITILSPKVYRSEAKLFVRLGRENTTVDSTATLGKDPVVGIPMSRENELNSVVELLSSRPLREQVVDELGPGTVLGTSLAAADDREPVAASVASPGAVRQAWESVSVTLDRLNLKPALSERDRAIVYLNKRLKIVPVKRSDVVSVAYDDRSPEQRRPWWLASSIGTSANTRG